MLEGYSNMIYDIVRYKSLRDLFKIRDSIVMLKNQGIDMLEATLLLKEVEHELKVRADEGRV